MENFVTALEKFFYEVIGQLLPGMFLLVGLFFVVPGDFAEDFKPTGQFEIWVFLAVSYCFGAALAALGQYFFIPVYTKCFQAILNRFLKKEKIEKFEIKKLLVSNEDLNKSLENEDSYKIISQRFKGVGSLRTLRNVAMSSIDGADKETTVRLMFISLLSQGVATSIIILTVVSVVSIWIDETYPILGAILASVLILVFGIALALPFVLLEREFFARARRLPLDCYLATLKSSPESDGTSKNSHKVIYLSGGHRSGWQDFIMRSAGGFEFIDPSKNGLSDSKAYTSWDLYSIDKCDIVFAYFESTNPSGYGLALEVGYAAAKGKHVIFVDEKSESDRNLSKYVKIIREASDAVFESIDEGVNYLKSLP